MRMAAEIELFTSIVTENKKDAKYNAYILIAGCGKTAHEFKLLKENNFKHIVAIDPQLSEEGDDLLRCSLEELSVNYYGQFDYIFSYHVLEHTQDPRDHLMSMKKYLKIDGHIFLGIPNKNRIFGYLGGNATLKEKFIWNIIDYGYRLKNKFENYYGAHAGFTEDELEKMFDTLFTYENISMKYYAIKYKGLKNKILTYRRLRPSIYYMLKNAN
jgi:SAM-dependent methyltransferase